LAIEVLLAKINLQVNTDCIWCEIIQSCTQILPAGDCWRWRNTSEAEAVEAWHVQPNVYCGSSRSLKSSPYCSCRRHNLYRGWGRVRLSAAWDSEASCCQSPLNQQCQLRSQ